MDYKISGYMPSIQPNFNPYPSGLKCVINLINNCKNLESVLTLIITSMKSNFENRDTLYANPRICCSLSVMTYNSVRQSEHPRKIFPVN